MGGNKANFVMQVHTLIEAVYLYYYLPTATFQACSWWVLNAKNIFGEDLILSFYPPPMFNFLLMHTALYINYHHTVINILAGFMTQSTVSHCVYMRLLYVCLHPSNGCSCSKQTKLLFCNPLVFDSNHWCLTGHVCTSPFNCSHSTVTSLWLNPGNSSKSCIEMQDAKYFAQQRGSQI